MSKNFELMQQLEKEKVLKSDFEVASASSYRASYDSNAKLSSMDDETLRLVQQVFVLQSKEPPRVVVFAGIDHGNGCSQIATSVAEILSINARKPVCLVEANFRSPSLARLADKKVSVGLSDALVSDNPILSFTTPTTNHNLWLLPAGPVAVDSSNLLASERLKERIEHLRREFEFVIVDAPPLSHYSDAVALGKQADGIVLILEADQTRRESATAASVTLRMANVPIFAAVLNKRKFPIPDKVYKRL